MKNDPTLPRRAWGHRLIQLGPEHERRLLRHFGNRANAARAAAQRQTVYGFHTLYRAMCGQPSTSRVIEILEALRHEIESGKPIP